MNLAHLDLEQLWAEIQQRMLGKKKEASLIQALQHFNLFAAMNINLNYQESKHPRKKNK